MNDYRIVRPRLKFESEFGQHRNWWVRDSRLTGNPLSVLLYLLSHDPSRMPTQTEARKQLGLGKDAWISAKKRLLEAGFIIEVRDRYPAGFVDEMGRPKGGQKRYRLFLQDPNEGYFVAEHLAILEFDEPYEEFLAANEETRVGFSEAADKTPDRVDGGLSAVRGKPATGNPKAADNPPSLEEEKTRLGQVGYYASSNQPTNHTTREREVDAQLEALAPGCGLTLAALSREVQGRVDLSTVDVVQATRDTLLRAAGRVNKPASYIASVIARYPTKWPVGGDGTAPFDPTPPASGFATERHASACARGEHWWGNEKLPEIDRSHCADCGQPRRNVDSAFAELEAELLAVSGDR
ncbi:hypothetical protein ACFWHR_12085 [Leucobacter sp. NPDC058333]|uniref:hypothetical protein n=1 Tax=Leucobacter sp. NPDC058333 TaxID=3346450 RepID=UPI0036534525